MTPWMPHLLAVLGGYLLGSVSFGLLWARARGVDLRAVGSGNVGATNVTRALGRRAGICVYFLDMLKGFVPALAGLALADDVGVGVAAGAAAVAGHVWPAWLRFRGGKGVATLSGALAALHPWTVLAAGAAWLAVFMLARIVSLASLVFALGLPAAAWSLGAPRPVAWFATAAAAFLFYTHRSNLKRLLSGQEKPMRRVPEGGR